MWVDLYNRDKEEIPRPIDVQPPPPVAMELRAIIWNTRDVQLVDKSFQDEMMTDIYVRGWLAGLDDDRQQTDVHYRSLDGSGNFNWRMIFPFVFEPRTKKIFRATPEQEAGAGGAAGEGGEKGAESGGAASTAGGFKLFQVRKEQKRLDPNLHVQIFDNDLFPGTDDFIGETLLNLNELRPVLTRRSKKSFVAQFAEDAVTCCGIWPFSKICRCCKKRDATEVDLTLEERQEIAREERQKEKEENRKRVQSIVDGKMEVLRASGKFAPAALAKMERRIKREARRANRVCVFKEFLPRRQKKSERLKEDKAHAAAVRETEREARDDHAFEPTAGAGQSAEGGLMAGLSRLTNRFRADQGKGGGLGKVDPSVPKVAETAKYWFSCSGPNGGCRVGDVQLSFQLCQIAAMQRDSKLAAGKGRSEPQSLPEPDRPDSSFFWLSSPWRAAVHIFWKNYKWYILTILCLIVSAILLYLLISNGIRVKADKYFD